MNPNSFEMNAPELLIDLAKRIEQQLIEKGLTNTDNARQFAIELSQSVAKDWGGQQVYIPKNLSSILNERDYAIYQDFNGRNHAELAKKYNVSVQWVYKIINKIHSKAYNKIQGDLFIMD